MKCLRVLRTRLSELRQAGPSTDRTEGILLQVRQLLDNRPYRQECAVLTFMCHCACHSDLHDSPVIYGWLSKLTRSRRGVLAERRATNFVPYFFDGATILDLDRLRRQLGEVLRREGLDTLIVEHQHYWHQFVRGLLDIMSDKEIGLPDGSGRLSKAAGRYVDEMTALPGQSYVRSIRVLTVGLSFKVEVTPNDETSTLFTVRSLMPPAEYETAGFEATEYPHSLMEIDPRNGNIRCDLPPSMPIEQWLAEFVPEMCRRAPAIEVNRAYQWGNRLFPGIGSMLPSAAAEFCSTHPDIVEMMTRPSPADR